jgi:hypothetical protein
MSLRRTGYALTAVLTLLGVSACGSTGGGSVVVRVGDATITSAAVEHWTNVVRRNGAFRAFFGHPTGTPKQRALISLISAGWLVGEAARIGLPVSAKAVDASLAERMQGAGGVEFRKRLEGNGQTASDVKLELAAEMALEAISDRLTRRAEQFRQADLARFYRENRELFAKVPETRAVDIIEYLPSAAAATALVRRAGTGRRFTALAIHKRIQPTLGTLAGPATKKAVDRAIFAARPGVVSQPMRFNGEWTVFIVRKIVPAQVYSLAEARPRIASSLAKERKREMEHAFATQYKRRWTSKTTCAPHYVVPGCAQYHGPPGDHEDPFAVNPFL